MGHEITVGISQGCMKLNLSSCWYFEEAGNVLISLQNPTEKIGVGATSWKTEL